jgi:PAS domain S-box-containing protein
MAQWLEVVFKFLLTEPIRVLSVSDSIQCLLGFQPEEFFSGHVALQSLIHPHDLDLADHLFSDALPSSDTFTLRLRQASGRIRIVRAHYTKKLDAVGYTVLELLLQDVKGLYQPHADFPMMVNFRAMMENTDDYIYFKDHNHVFTGASQTLVSLCSPAEHWTDLLGQTDYDVFPEEYADIYYMLEKRVFAGFPVAQDIQETLDKEGNHGWVDNRKYPIRDDTGAIIGLFGIARDITENKQAELKLKASEIRARAVLAATPVPLAINDRQGNILDLNPAFVAAFGYTIDDIPDLESWWPKAYPDPIYRQQIKVEWGVLLTEGPITQASRPLEVFIVDKQGKSHRVLVSCVDIDDDRCLVMLYDITERHDLQIAHDRLMRSVKASHNEIFLFDAYTLLFFFVNEGALCNLGYTLDEMRQMTPLDLKPMFTQDLFESMIAPLRQHETSMLHFDTVHRRKNGDLYDVEVNLQLFEPLGEQAYFMAIISDVTEKRMLQQELSSIVASADAIIWSANSELKLTFVSDKVRNMLGLEPHHFIGTSLLELLVSEMFHEEDRNPQLQAVKEMIETHCPIHNFEHRARRMDGSWVWLSVGMTPLYSADGKLCQIVGVVHDLTPQKQAQAELEALNRELDQRVEQAIGDIRQRDLLLLQKAKLAAIGEMIGNIAHQWRQPLNALSLILMDLEDAFAHNEADANFLQQAVSRSHILLQKMSDTIDDFRHFFQHGKSIKSVDLAEVARELAQLFESSLQHFGIDLYLELDEAVFVRGFPGEIYQALLCLVNNAKEQILETHPDQGAITIEVRRDNGWGLLRVQDNAGGIPEAVFPRIFEPYYTSKPEGSGLGLYITRLAVENSMHGRVFAENVAEGASFTLQLPLTIELGEDHEKTN